MSANPFYVAPAGDVSSGLAGIGSVLKDVGEQRKMREEEEAARLANEQAQIEINDAIQSGDINTLRTTAVKYPQVADAIYKGFQAQKDEDKSSTLGWLRQVAVAKDPMQAKSVLEREISRLDTIGRDSSVLRGELMDLESDPEGFLQSSRLGYAAIAPENEYKAYLESTKAPAMPQTREVKKGDIIVTEQFNPQNGQFEVIAEAPRFQKTEAGGVKYQSDIGKLFSDRDAAVATYGENSKQVKSIDSLIEQSGKDYKAEEIAAKSTEEAQKKSADLDAALFSMDNMLNTMGKILSTPFGVVKRATGPIESRIPTTSQDVADLEERINNLDAQAFMSQVPLLKGMGALSNAEGQKLSASLQNFSLRQSATQLLENVTEAERLILKARENIAKKYNLEAPPPDTNATVTQAGQRNITVDY